uniref:Probable queuine tRNA-ribosyltransferase n=1 Tax=Culex pipiens TaxID=7175 RepID=A0A8D8BUX9_CULPI
MRAPRSLPCFKQFLRRMSSTSTAEQPAPTTATTGPPLQYRVLAKCSRTKARVGVMSLRHSDVDTPVFMPVGTQVRLVTMWFEIWEFKSYGLFLGDAEGIASGSDYGVGLSDNAGEYLSLGDATGDGDLEEGWWVARLYGLAPGAVDRFGRVPDGFVAAVGGDN